MPRVNHKKPVRLSIMGNMGPEADELAQKELRLARIRKGAQKDQDHLPVVVIKNPNIPDRTAHILNPETNPSPVPEMINSAKLIERCQSFLGWMPCNTAHKFRNAVQEKIEVYFIDMLAETVNSLPSHTTIAHLATTGTVQSKLYDPYFQEKGIPFHIPSANDQETYVHGAIYGTLKEDGTRESNGLKAGVYEPNAKLLATVIQKLKDEEGINTVNLGCTELPLVERELQQAHPDIVFVNPMTCAAEALNNIYEKVQEKLNSQSISGAITKPSHIQNENHDHIADYVAFKISQTTFD
jgi:aspartate racemase